MFLFSRPALPLPGLTTPSAADLAAKSGAAPESQALIKPGMSSSEYVHALEQNKQSVDAVKALAHGMPERDSVSWATQSSQKVANKLNPEEKAATQAAEAWTKNPTASNQAAAAEAASKTDFKGPGGWAAQAAAWSKSPATPAAPAASGIQAPATPGAPPAPAAPALTAAAVVGSILLAAGLAGRPAMPAPQKPDIEAQPIRPPQQPQAPTPSQPQTPPLDQSKMAKSLQPFIDLGKAIASGKGSVV